MIEYSWIANILSTAIISVMGWIMKTMNSRIVELENKVQDTREKYVHKDDLKELKFEMSRRFDEIKELLILFKTTKE